MGTIREYKKQDGTPAYHAEVRLRGHPIQRESHRTRTLAKSGYRIPSLLYVMEGILKPLRLNVTA